MTIMDLLKKIGSNKSKQREKFKEAQEDLKIQTMLEERQKSSNRREFERYVKEQEEMKIKQALDKIHKKQTSENWKGTSLLKGKSILANDRPILMEKNIFLDNKTKIPIGGGSMFFKW